MKTWLYQVLRPFIKLFVLIFIRPKYIGLENIPNNEHFILSGNHTSYLDCLILISSTKKTIHFLAKDSLFKGLKKIIFQRMGLIPVNRHIHDKEALNKALTVLNNKGIIGIFPEGTIHQNYDIGPFKIGSVKMSYETKTKIVPFVIYGKYKFFKRNISIEFLKPILINDSNLSNQNNYLRNLIIDKLKEKRI